MDVRRYEEADHDAVLALAPRLTEGVAPWRPRDAVHAAVVGWVRNALQRAAEPGHCVFVAVDRKVDGEVVAGFVSGEQRAHWSGEQELYVGELVVAREYEGRGVGRMLIDAVTERARRDELTTITLDTGAANTKARAFYRRLGFVEEDVKLTRQVR